VQAAQDVKGLDKKIDNSINGIKSKDGKKISPISLNVSIGSSSKTQNSTNEIVQAKGSQISAGKNLDITATEGNVHVQGSTLTGDNIHIQAVKDVKIESAENQTSNKTQNDGKSSGIGAQISASGIGFYAEASKNKELENGTILTHTPSEVTAKETLNIEAGQDVNILGSKASGDRVEVSAGRDLNLASQQDIDKYNEQSSSSGGKIGTAGIGLQGNSSRGKIDSNYESVTRQAEIHAGQGGFAIEVGKNTDLKGAVISSDATPDKNKLSTDTLTYSDIQNKADYSANSKGYSTQAGSKFPITPNVTMPVSGDASSTTKSAISNGIIEVRSNPTQDLSQLNRDTENALNALGKIFDKETVKEKHELANLFGQEAYKAVGDLAEKQWEKATTKEEKAKWAEGGEYKNLLHAVVGGIMSELGGNGFTSGAVGAGTSQVLQKVLSKIGDPNIRLIASAILGGAAAKIVSGKTYAGVATAYYGTRYNDYTHRPTTPGSIIYRENDEKGVGQGYYMVGEDGLEYYQQNGVEPGDIYWIADGNYDENGYQMGNEWIVGDDGKPIAFSWNTVQMYVGDLVSGSTVSLEIAINQETHKAVSINDQLAMTYDSNEKYNQAMADYEENKKIPELIASFVNPSSKVGGFAEAIIAGYKSDVTHIINGSRSSASGHSWEVFFDGVKPSFEKIKPYIANVLEHGNITRTDILKEESKIVYRSLNIDGFEVWTKEFIEDGVSRLSDAGVNNW